MLTMSQQDFNVDLPNETYFGTWSHREVVILLEETDYKIPVKRSYFGDGITVKVVVRDGVAEIESCHPKYFYQGF